MQSHPWIKPMRAGLAASLVLLGIYFLVLSLVSGSEFALDQFNEFWYFVIALALGFGMQITLYSRLREVTRHTDASGKVVATTGATSTGAMVACCAHYLTNVLPILGATGLVALVAQYQVHLFWIGLAINLAGVAYIGRKTAQAVRHMALMEAQK